MNPDRRRLLTLAAAASAILPAGAAAAAPISALGLDGAQFGLRPGGPDDQSRTLQRAIEAAANARAPLALAPGVYRVGNLRLPAGAQLVGVRGQTRLVFTEGPSLISGEGADHFTLTGLVLDGVRRRLPERRGLVHIENARGVKIADCQIMSAGGDAIHCVAVAGEVVDTTLTDSVEAAIHSDDARGTSPSVGALLAEEERRGMCKLAAYSDFQARATFLRHADPLFHEFGLWDGDASAVIARLAPAVGRVRLPHIDAQKFGAVAITAVQVVQDPRLGSIGPSGKAAEDEHDRFLAAELR